MDDVREAVRDAACFYKRFTKAANRRHFRDVLGLSCAPLGRRKLKIMRRFLIRLAVALATFVAGVKLAWAFGLLFGPALKPGDVRPAYVAPPVVKVRECPTRSLSLVDIPEPPPPPPAPRPSKQTRIVIRQADGTVRIIEKRK